jgi:hypothetical protein
VQAISRDHNKLRYQLMQCGVVVCIVNKHTAHNTFQNQKKKKIKDLRQNKKKKKKKLKPLIKVILSEFIWKNMSKNQLGKRNKMKLLNGPLQ